MIATNTYGRRVTLPRLLAIFGWLSLGLVYVTFREIAANVNAWLEGKAEKHAVGWHTSGPLLFPPT